MSDLPTAAAPQSRPLSPSRRAFLWLAAAVILAVALYAGLGYLAASLTHETTDDAFIDGPIVLIAPKVAGIVKAVRVVQNQPVRQGDPLVEIDSRDFESQAERKRSALAGAEANRQMIAAGFDYMQKHIQTAEADAAQSAADAAAAEATAVLTQAEFTRASGLRGQGILSGEEFDSAKAAADSAAAALQSAREKVRSGKSKVEEVQSQLMVARSGFDQAAAQVREALADVTNAGLTLSYTVIHAPSDGLVTRKNVEPGSYVQVGQQLMALVPNEFWVTANFKETQLIAFPTNGAAEIEIDSVQGRRFRGHVESIQAGSGARFSLLPPENAVGNFVKVVQRVPVKILFDEPVQASHVLGPGMSVSASVRTANWDLSPLLRALAALLAGAIVGGLGWSVTAKRAAAAGKA